MATIRHPRRRVFRPDIRPKKRPNNWPVFTSEYERIPADSDQVSEEEEVAPRFLDCLRSDERFQSLRRQVQDYSFQNPNRSLIQQNLGEFFELLIEPIAAFQPSQPIPAPRPSQLNAVPRPFLNADASLFSRIGIQFVFRYHSPVHIQLLQRQHLRHLRRTPSSSRLWDSRK